METYIVTLRIKIDPKITVPPTEEGWDWYNLLDLAGDEEVEEVEVREEASK